jgi:transposase, IS30 family
MARTYRQLDLDQRRTLFRLVEARRPLGEIAARLGRHPSTIYRELGRNRFRDGDRGFCGYFPLTAQDLARRRRQRRRKLAADETLRAHVVGRLEAGWSPPQIAGRLKQEAPDRPSVCHERDHLPARPRPGRPRGRPLPPPAEGAPSARKPPRPQAPRRLDPARALDREPAR